MHGRLRFPWPWLPPALTARRSPRCGRPRWADQRDRPCCPQPCAPHPCHPPPAEEGVVPCRAVQRGVEREQPSPPLACPSLASAARGPASAAPAHLAKHDVLAVQPGRLHGAQEELRGGGSGARGRQDGARAGGGAGSTASLATCLAAHSRWRRGLRLPSPGCRWCWGRRWPWTGCRGRCA